MELPIVLVTGKNGQLGSELQQLALQYTNQYHFVFTDKSELDITNPDAIRDFFEQHNPQFCINCAAYTAVDKAETQQQQAYAVNAEAVNRLAKACSANNSVFISFSTDYVFDGTANQPYAPNHITNPINYYGYSKYMGEQLALSNCEKTIIIRTSWVYSSYGHNFVKTMLRLMNERKEINVVNDQYGCPTYAADLAKAVVDILQLLKTNSIQPFPNGIYHYANAGVISWFQFAQAIQQLTQLPCKVNHITSSAYPTAAKRPAFSVLNTEKIMQVFGLQPQQWQQSLQHCLTVLKVIPG
ncbi:dTDP-4-dehydrorhamnose reductase [Hydrotalea sp.]|uniref:dTDP-4-dehydrorhamnose reductase n=1 Tax=Hydrotalea sp. TaxID=2881279 RepID=UPI002614D7CC|nr:dTDP-4-dehydrorhamnose reductase [Hydrotalea sp.]